MMSSMTSAPPTLDAIRRAPKVLLHDHLDGGLRPATIVELAQEHGYGALPATDPAALAAWMTQGADRHDLVLYLETFQHTVGVMQTAEALARVARECAQDLSDDGVVYAEVRFAPEQHLEQGLSLDEVVEAVVEGFAAGVRRPADHRSHTADRDADGRAQPRDRRARGAMARSRGGGVRHRGCGGRLPAHPAPRCVRLRAA